MDEEHIALKAVLAAFTQPAALLSPEGECLFANDLFRTITGMPSGTLQAERPFPNLQSEAALTLAQALKGAAATRLLIETTGPDKAERQFHLSLHPLGQKEGAENWLAQIDWHPSTPPSCLGDMGRSDQKMAVIWSYDRATGRFQGGHDLAKVLGEVTGKSLPSFLDFCALQHEEDAERIQSLLSDEQYPEATDLRTIHRMRHQSGDWRWFQTHIHRVPRENDGMAPLIYGFSIDITHLKGVEAGLLQALKGARHAQSAAESARCKLEQQVEFFDLATVTSDVLAWHHDLETGETSFSEGWTSPFGGNTTDPLSVRAWFRMIHPEDRRGAIAQIKDLLKGRGDSIRTDLRLRLGHEQWRWFSVRARCVDRSLTGKPPLICGVLIDVQEEKQTATRLEEVLRQLQRERSSARRSTQLLDVGAICGHVGPWTYGRHAPDIWMHDACFRQMGYEPGEFVPDSETWLSLLHPADSDTASREMSRLLAGRLQDFDHVFRFRHKNGDYQRYRTVARRVAPDTPGQGVYIVGALSRFDQAHLPTTETPAHSAGPLQTGRTVDVTDRHTVEPQASQALSDLQEAHDRLSMIADIAPVGLYAYRQTDSSATEILFASRKYRELLGMGTEDLSRLARLLEERTNPADLLDIRTSRERHANGTVPLQTRFRFLHPERGLMWIADVAMPRRDEHGSVIWTGALHDVTGDVQREAELRRAHRLAEKMRTENEWQALHDGLTGLPNRRYYDKIMSTRIEEARNGAPKDCVLIRIDLDHFKYVNDTLGHEAGDKVLERVADVLRHTLRGGDFAARIGGDEFSILLSPGLSSTRAREVVERIQKQLAEPMDYQGRICRFGASFGIAQTEHLEDVGLELQLFADAALYKAKEGGRNRIEVFTTDLHHVMLSDRALAEELQNALERDEFQPHFQPQVSARDGALVGVETLLRWQHPKRGLLLPNQFMHVVQQLRILPEIDKVMMTKARHVLNRLHDAGLSVPKISFNVSAARMHDPDIVAMASEVRQSGTRVALELVESTLVEQESDAFKFHIDKLSDAGIEIEVDDFGSGHASIIGLMEIAPSALKIDRRIIAPVAKDRRARNLVRAIVEIAETLGIRTIAEGVETEDQKTVLRDIGCNVLQGYAISHPLDERALGRFLETTDEKAG